MKSYYIFTLGCQMNISDSQRIATKLEKLGYKSAPEEEADLVIINACSVRQSAVDRIWGKIKNWKTAKKKILITGCVLPQDKKKFQEKEIQYFPIPDLGNLEYYLNKQTINNVSDRLLYFEILPKNNHHQIAYIPIMTGCDNFCSYCAVPYTRGREISRPMTDVIYEVKGALKDGAKEIWLLGQNVNSYGIKSEIRNTPSGMHSETNSKQIKNDKFIKLLKAIDNIDGEFKFNFISSNPHDMDDELIKTFADLKKWPRQLHLAIQSGDDEILKKMNRKYNSKQFLKLVASLKSLIPDIILTTDIIVGFPGETKKQFENTIKICKKIGFQKAYIAQYSPRPGTIAAKLEDNVPAIEKKRRWLKLDELINKR